MSREKNKRDGARGSSARRTGMDAACAGFRPAAVAAALAAVFGMAAAVRAQPVGGHAIAGSASFARSGADLVVTTRNAPGANHSTIQWQSFSVPAGSVTHFNQPSASSTSINRVLGPDPSAIFGTLRSNGRIVLVNPAGIAVGQGAVVDTAGFTASTLDMTEADARAGLLRFGATGHAGALQVHGQVLAREGDVVLLAPDAQVGADAVVRAPHGATILAAGRKVALTGRGLEGIRFELQAPQDRAVNLGRLEGDAVGVFASQLRHSGSISATAATAAGGKVVLQAGDVADVAGKIAATRGAVGGQVHATAAGKLVLRSTADVDVSGREGGGEALLGGGWQGRDARIANARDTLAETGSTVRANATQAGNGGTVVLWADRQADVGGRIEARGGPAGGHGGRVETSGKAVLRYRAQVDTSAPRGKAGVLLLDPVNITIGASGSHDPLLSDSVLQQEELATGDATLSAATLASLTGNVILKASNDILFADLVGDELVLSAATALILEAGGKITHADANDRIKLTTAGAPVQATAAAGKIALGGIHTKGGAVTLSAGSEIAVREIRTTDGAGGVAGGDVSLQAAAGIGGGASGAATVAAARLKAENTASGNIRLRGADSSGIVVHNLGAGSGAGIRNGASAGDVELEFGSIALHAPLETGGTAKLVAAHGGVTQLEAGAISAARLSVQAAGDVLLDGAANRVSDLAGAVSASGKVFRFHNAKALNITSVGALNGIQTSFADTWQDAADAYLVLTSAGAIAQDASGTLRAKAVYAKGSSVQLTAANATGVVAGAATGGATGDSFAYRSDNQILVTNVAGGNGIAADHGRPVTLVSTAQGVQVAAPIHAGSVTLEATTAGRDVRVAADLTANASAGKITLKAGNDVILGGTILDAAALELAVGGGAANAARVTGAATFRNLRGVTGAGAIHVDGGTLNIEASADGVLLPRLWISGGSLGGDGSVSVSQQFRWSGGSLARGTATNSAPRLVLDAAARGDITGPVTLTRALTNHGVLALSGSGSLAFGAGGVLHNQSLSGGTAVIDIQNDRGFSGAGGTVTNEGVFQKTGASGTSTITGLGFANASGGTVRVAAGTLRFDAGVFPSNSGWLDIGSGTTLVNYNTTLASTPGATIAGNGTLHLGDGVSATPGSGAGSLNNHGTLKPGGRDAIGALKIVAAAVNNEAGSDVVIDHDGSSYDRLQVAGTTAFVDAHPSDALRPRVTLNALGGALAAGHYVLVDGASTGTPELRSGPDGAVLAGGASLTLTVAAATPPAVSADPATNALPAPTSTTQSPVPGATPVSTQSPVPVANPVSTPSPLPVANPVSTPSPVTGVTPVSTPSPVPGAIPVSTPSPSPVPTPASPQAPVPASTAVPAPVPTQEAGSLPRPAPSPLPLPWAGPATSAPGAAAAEPADARPSAARRVTDQVVGFLQLARQESAVAGGDLRMPLTLEERQQRRRSKDPVAVTATSCLP